MFDIIIDLIISIAPIVASISFGYIYLNKRKA
ncbi:hypothetical protein Cp4437_02272 [Clostridium perfringens]|nr:hypothetical protein [Clostridium perfringens]